MNHERIVFSSKVLEADVPNKNGSLYPRQVIEKAINDLKENVANRSVLGELGEGSTASISFANVSHVVTKTWFENNELFAEAEVLNTPNGSLLKDLLNKKVPVCLRLRGVGEVQANEEGHFVVGDSYKAITLDVVEDSRS